MALAVDWLNDFKKFWGDSFDQLDAVLVTLKQNQSKEPDHE
jgi:hypothetical protein